MRRSGAWAFRRWNNGRLPEVTTGEPVKVQPKPPVSNELPAVTVQHPGWVHVYRAWHHQNRPQEWRWECIFESPSAEKAESIAAVQKHRVIVTDKHGKILFQGHGPMRIAGVIRHLLDAQGKVICCPRLDKHDDDTEYVNIRDAAQFPDFMATVCPLGLRMLDQDGELI